MRRPRGVDPSNPIPHNPAMLIGPHVRKTLGLWDTWSAASSRQAASVASPLPFFVDRSPQQDEKPSMSMARRDSRVAFGFFVVLISVVAAAAEPKNWTAAQDHQNMMDQLGIKSLR